MLTATQEGTQDGLWSMCPSIHKSNKIRVEFKINQNDGLTLLSLLVDPRELLNSQPLPHPIQKSQGPRARPGGEAEKKGEGKGERGRERGASDTHSQRGAQCASGRRRLSGCPVSHSVPSTAPEGTLTRQQSREPGRDSTAPGRRLLPGKQ